jgi:microcystin-dependent protein
MGAGTALVDEVLYRRGVRFFSGAFLDFVGTRGLHFQSAVAWVLMIGVWGATVPVVSRAQQVPFIGEVMCGGWNFCPAGWAECNGQQLPISGNEALFALITTTYGGNGINTFAVPNIQSRTVLGAGLGPGLSNRQLGELGGLEEVRLQSWQMPNHSHDLRAHSGAERAATPRDRVPGVAPAGSPIYGTAANTQLAPATVTQEGGSQPHNNLQPYLVVKCCISLYGTFP